MFLNNHHYTIVIYIGITTSMSLALSTSTLFISLLQLINRAQFLNITPFSIHFFFKWMFDLMHLILIHQ